MDWLEELFEGWETQHYAILGVLGALYLLSCVRMGLAARRYGRSPLLWSLITIFCTPIPAAIVYHMDSVRASKDYQGDAGHLPPGRDAVLACPHCEGPLGPQDLRGAAGGPIVCPHCNAPIDRSSFS